MKARRHYISMSGLHGCMPDYCDVSPDLESAVDLLTSLFDLGRDRRRELKRSMSLELNNRRDGAEYCEIVECDCDSPHEHSEDGFNADRWNADNPEYFETETETEVQP